MQVESNDSGDADIPSLGIDASGNAIAVWEQFDGSRIAIWASRRTGSGWSVPEKIDAAGNSSSAQVAVDGAGNAVAVWEQTDGSVYDIYARHYQAGVGWGAPVNIESGSENAFGPQVVMDGAGNALVVWYQLEGGGARYSIWANRRVSNAWQTAVLLESTDDDAREPRVAMDAAGSAVVVWDQQDGAVRSLWATQLVDGTWLAPVQIENENAGSAFDHRVAMDGSGNAVVVWTQNNGVRNLIWANRFAWSDPYITGAWGAAGAIQTDTGVSASFPSIAFDGLGNAYAVWRQAGTTYFDAWARRHTTAGGWGTAAPIETEDLGSVTEPRIAADGEGNAIAVWTQYDGEQNSVYSNRYAAGGGWGTAQKIETDNTDSAYAPQVAMNDAGTAVAVWAQGDGTWLNLWANVFD